jgi:hypothetical protein
LSVPHKEQLIFPILADLVPRGDGSFVMRPKLSDAALDTWVTPKQAAVIIGIGKRSVYDLLDETEPMLVSRRPLSRRVVISLKSIQEFKRATSEPGFWSASTPEPRRQLIERVRASIAALCNPTAS